MFGWGKKTPPAQLAAARARIEQQLGLIQGCRKVHYGVYDIASITPFGPLSFRVSLGPDFPDSAPDLRLLVQATHPWVNKALVIAHHPQLVKWRPDVDLPAVCRQIQAEFTRNPPKPVANPVPVAAQPVQRPAQLQPPRGGYPGQVGSAGSYPGGSSPLHASPSPSPQPPAAAEHRPFSRSYDAGAPQQRPPSGSIASDLPPPAFQERDAPPPLNREPSGVKMQAPPLPDSFPELDAYTTQQLRDMMSDKYAMTEFMGSLDPVKNLKSMRDDLYKQVETAANKNLDHRDHVRIQAAELESLRSELAAKQLHLRDISTRQQQIIGAYSTAALINGLSAKMEEAEEDSDLLHRKFLDEEVETGAFSKDYMALRLQYHMRAAKKERLAEMSGR